MTELLLVRHGLPESGVRDPGLSATGVEQARRLAAWLEPDGIDAIVTSGMTRARETAAVLEERLGLTAKVLDELREWDRDVPVSQYTPIEEMQADDPRAVAIAEGRFEDFVPQLDLPAFRRRVVAALDLVFELYAESAQRVVVSTHGGLMNAYLAHLLDSPKVFWHNPAYTGVSRVERLASGRTVIRSINETGHLLGVRT